MGKNTQPKRIQSPEQRALFKELRKRRYQQRVGWGHKYYKRKPKYKDTWEDYE